MTSLLGILALGFFLGMRHASDPDHVIAVTTLVARHRSVRGAALIGAVWGLGHTLTIMTVGSCIILLGWVIPARIGLSLELSVGVMLVILGIATMAGSYRRIRRATRSGHEQEPHSHNRSLDRWLGGMVGYQLVRPLVVGIVHGLAGSAAVALLVLAAIRDPAWAVFYLGVFGGGTIIGMMLITVAVALPFRYAEGRLVRFGEGLRIASGALSIGFGLFVAYRIGIVQGLFTGAPSWTPR